MVAGAGAAEFPIFVDVQCTVYIVHSTVPTVLNELQLESGNLLNKPVIFLIYANTNKDIIRTYLKPVY